MKKRNKNTSSFSMPENELKEIVLYERQYKPISTIGIKKSAFVDKDSKLTKEDFKETKIDKEVKETFFKNNSYKTLLTKEEIKFLCNSFGIKKEDFNKKVIPVFDRDNAYNLRMMSMNEILKSHFIKEKSIGYLSLCENPETMILKSGYEKLMKNEEAMMIQIKEVPRTDISNIHSVNEFFIDIDSSNPMTEETAYTYAVYLNLNLDALGMRPNVIQDTGSGLHLHYYINEVYLTHQGNVSLLKDTKEYVTEVVENVLYYTSKDVGNNVEYIDARTGGRTKRSKLSVDRTSAFRPVGRLIGSINEKTNRVSKILISNDDKRHMLGSLIQIAKQALGIENSGKEFIKFEYKTGKKNNNIAKLNSERKTAFESILIYKGKGYRNRTYFLLIQNLLMSGWDDKRIFRYLKNLDRKLEEPYFNSDYAIISMLESTKRNYNNANKDINDQIYYKNETLLRIMNLTREELEYIDGCEVFTRLTKQEKREKTKKEKQEKKDNFLKVYMDNWTNKTTNKSYLNKTQMCQRIGISFKTFNKYVNEFSRMIAEEKRAILKWLANLPFIDKVSSAAKASLLFAARLGDNLNRAKFQSENQENEKQGQQNIRIDIESIT